MSKFYICHEIMDEEFVYPLEEILKEMKNRKLTSIHIFNAIREVNVDHFFCGYYSTAGTTNESICGKSCVGYHPCNGKSGCCKHHKATYAQGKELILNINGKITRYV